MIGCDDFGMNAMVSSRIPLGVRRLPGMRGRIKPSVPTTFPSTCYGRARHLTASIDCRRAKCEMIFGSSTHCGWSCPIPRPGGMPTATSLTPREKSDVYAQGINIPNSEAHYRTPQFMQSPRAFRLRNHQLKTPKPLQAMRDRQSKKVRRSLAQRQ